jgi:hypothetical protein
MLDAPTRTMAYHLNLCSQRWQPQRLATRAWNNREISLRHDVHVAYSTETNTLEGGQGEYIWE